MKRGFTLIELIVVVSMIALLASLILIVYPAPRAKARDSRRVSDLRQYQTALEAYANSNDNLYVVSGGVVHADTICTDLVLGGCATDPSQSLDPTYFYGYSTDAGGTNYVLWAKLEGEENYFILCSGGSTGQKPQAGWSNPTNGNCPL